MPIKTLFLSNQEYPTHIESSDYTINNHPTHPFHVTVSGMKEERNIEDIELLQMNGISPFSYTGQARQVTNEVNPSFSLVSRFSF